tara:strand:- start:300 stop:458 length:159 start_codon:yes stop_codon:yes gene_type:complete
MKLKKPKEETPKYEGKFWSYPRRAFVGYDQWLKEANHAPLCTGALNESKSTK